MNEEKMNLELRKFLKKFGVTSQQKIEHALFKTLEEGSLGGTKVLNAKATLEVPELGIVHAVEGKIALD